MQSYSWERNFTPYSDHKNLQCQHRNSTDMISDLLRHQGTPSWPVGFSTASLTFHPIQFKLKALPRTSSHISGSPDCMHTGCSYMHKSNQSNHSC